MDRPQFTHMLTLYGGMDEDMGLLEDLALEASDSDPNTIHRYAVDSAQQALRCLPEIGNRAQLLMIAPYGTAPLSTDKVDSSFVDQDLKAHWARLQNREWVNFLTYTALLGYTIQRTFQAVPDTHVLVGRHFGDFNRWQDRLRQNLPVDHLSRIGVVDRDFNGFRTILKSW